MVSRRPRPAKKPSRAATQAPSFTLTSGQALASRLRRHHLHERAPLASMLEVVSDVVGLHAQLMSSAELTLHARVDGLGADSVQNALWKQRSLYKLWAMRGTLHLLPTSEVGLWQGALGTYRHYQKASWSKYFGVSPAQLEEVLAAVSHALEGRMLTREELADEVGRLTGSPALGDKLRESWGALLKPASFQGRLCFAPSQGQNVRFTRPDTWLDSAGPIEPDLAMREVVRRYLGAHGPATPEDLGRWWGGLSAAQSLRLLASVGEEAVQIEIEGARAWMLRADAAVAAEQSATGIVRLIPGFDQYTVGASRTVPGYVPQALRARIYRSQGWISPVLLVAGRMEGTWEYGRQGRSIAIAITPFGKLASRVRRDAEAEAERIARFLGGSLELRWEDRGAGRRSSGPAVGQRPAAH